MFPDPDKIELSEPDGCLVLDYRPHLQIQLRIGSWKKGLLIHRWGNGTWQPESEDPGLPLLWPSRLMEPTHPVRLFADRIPEHVRCLAEKFRHRQVNVLRMMSFSNRPMHMAQHAPVLLWFLADEMERRGWTTAQVDHLLGWNRIDLLWALCGDRSKPLLRLLLKICPERWEQDELQLIRQALGNQALRELACLAPDVSMPLMMAVMEFPCINACKRLFKVLVDEFQSIRPAFQLCRLINDTLRMAPEIGVGDINRKLARCGSYDEVRGLHDRITRRYNSSILDHRDLPRHRSTSAPLKFPPPPIPSGADFVAITTAEELYLEGQEMQHCVGSYAYKVAAGRCYIYKVLSPERATLELRPSNGIWAPAQLRLANNYEPSAMTWNRVQQWIDRNKD